MSRTALLPLSLIAALGACSGDATSTPADDTGTADVGGGSGADSGSGGESDAGGEDVIQIGDVSDPDTSSESRCEAEVVIEAWPLNNALSDGSIDTESAGDATIATIDASAGGMDASVGEPFVYLDLETGTMVDITDYESLEDGEWDLAFKRTNIRTNSGDSGPGTMELGKVSDTTFEAVTSADDVTQWETDISFDTDCVVFADPIGNPLTAINYLNPQNPTGSQSWYNYGNGVEPEPGAVYVVRNTTTGVAYKWEIQSWNSGTYTLRWAQL